MKREDGWFNGNITHAREMVEFGNAKLSTPPVPDPPKNMTAEREAQYTHQLHQRVRRNHFVLVTADMIANENTVRAAEAVGGTQKIHAMKPVAEGVGKFKDLMCPCAGCRCGDECEYDDMQEEWREERIPAETVAEPATLRPRAGEEWVGRRVAKPFKGVLYEGSVESFKDALYQIQYDDGDKEDLTAGELMKVIVPIEGADTAAEEEAAVRYARREGVLEMLRGGMDVAFQNDVDLNSDCYIVRLYGDGDECWYTVPKGETLTVHYHDPEGNLYSFGEGTKLLKGYMWFRRNTKDRKYELIDGVQLRKHVQTGWGTFPVTYFDPDTLLHMDIHMTPIAGNTVRKDGKWAYLSAEDEAQIESNVWDVDEDGE